MWLHVVNLIHIRKGAWKGYSFRITSREASQLAFCFCPEDRLDNYATASHLEARLCSHCVTKVIYSWPAVLEETFPFFQVNIDQLRIENLCIISLQSMLKP